MNKKLKVIIRCLVYNHEPYLRDCLEGFIMQKTNFPFKAVVHDDCSTDASAAIIREYAEKYPDIIEPIYETENQYSKQDGSLRRAMDTACSKRSKYFAYCEGDDYWIDPYKLQKQVDYMDSHPECTMTYTDVEVLTPHGKLSKVEHEKLWGEIRCNDNIADIDYIINHGAGTIHTCSIMRKADLIDDYPEAAKKCYVGDYPMEIFAALKGTVYGFSDKTAVYRFLSIGSWTSKQKCKATEKSLNNWISVINMIESMNEYSQYKYSTCFRTYARKYLLWGLSDNPHLFITACEKRQCLHIMSNEYDTQISPPPAISGIKRLLLKILYYPFTPFYFPIYKLAKKLTLWQRIKIAWKYFIGTGTV